MKKKITIKEIAKILMVSVSTVSKAMNDSPEISEKTKKKVKDLAKFYGYTPNHIAVSLKNQSTFNIGVIIPDIQNPFLAEVLKNIEITAKKKGYRIITFFTDEKLKEERESLNILSNGMVEGIIVCPSEETFVEREFKHFNNIAETTPIVTFDRIHKELDFNSVSVDDDQSILKACAHFKENNLKNILFVSSIGWLSVGKTRRRTFKSYMETEKAIEGETIEEHNLDELRAKIEARITDNSLPKIEAILGADIESTLIASASISRNKIKFIDEVSLIGYVNKNHNELQYPRVSYINQFPEKVGEKAVDLLINNLKEDHKKATLEIIKTEIVTKDTSK
ncbi:LacI family DNA-binding transcriptional regulator [Mesonia aestuariivivens]|uniref:LacI family transcriptional regulator n=1 Tax=Mesonia aestuariivivens TaxID=2796128 RepID=A0ABS6W336_9FLAO|nr:LacI family DNA-binding transcriptional regulator [Mesonia aestuariivivens]MBW2962271.1 LacI family transcriptional regulator [Mesonia aestuariivivens]